MILASSIRSCVKQGHGIGLVGRVIPDAVGDPELVERSLKHCLPPNQESPFAPASPTKSAARH
ncbi:hypothetical protein M4951_16315 [Blastopirellula sp. J2-11]|uniref:hypothetical protein n=1 Tax=Blastopirellula sp. J2-11 TaxID=2943192 RepID=UPI0021CAC4ED|nr:hypothetical protein [Blastopirellula sp. J2-11]UUO04945.1 hypothetical protein M4951_16315 [Blastopirellula sp. J2-11]